MNNYEEVKIIKGIKNDEDEKDIPIDYFSQIINYNYSDIGIQGLEKILMPEVINFLNDSYIDGMYEYRFLDDNNVLQKQYIGVAGGKIYKDILSSPIIIKENISIGKCSFAVRNDLLYIANGKDYIYIYDGTKGIVSQMGAPIAEKNGVGVLLGNYYWATTYITAGGEEILGSISNTLSLTNERVILNLPIGYDGTVQRKIYRTEENGSILKLLTTIADNTTLTYLDNTADISLTTQINDPNNELPKPYFILVYNERLIGAKVDKYPTQIFITGAEIDTFDTANGLDIANFSDDNSPVMGANIDFANVVIGTQRHFYLLDFTDGLSVIATRVNVGLKDGYSLVRVPTYGNFHGGLMFISSNNDVRILVGIRALPVATSIDNISSENLAQNIRGTLLNALTSPSNIYATYYNYKYHLVIDGNKFVFDIRTAGWTYHSIQTENYKSNPYVLAVLNNFLYNGQIDGYIEQEYKNIEYKNEDVVALLESSNIKTSNKYKFIFWFLPSENNKLKITVVADDDKYFVNEHEFEYLGGSFDDEEFNNSEFNTAIDLDYKIVNVNRPVRWIKFKLENTKGNIIFNGWGIFSQSMTGKE